MSEGHADGIDEALVPFSEMLASIIPDGEQFVTEDGAMIMESLKIDMPIELDVVQDENGGLAVGSSPPLYYVETGFSPVMHQVTFTLKQESELREDDE
jgi:hypothetical protein